MKNKLIILGAGGYGQTIADMAEQSCLYERIAFLDDSSKADNVLGKCEIYKKYKKWHIYPAFGDNKLRLNWIKRLEKEGFIIPILIHNTAYVSPKVKIENGTVVLPHAVINTNCVIEKGCIINCGAIIDHGCVIEQGCHICLGAIIKAENRIKQLTKVDANELVQARFFSVKEI